MKQVPATLMEAIRYFEDPDVCIEFVASLRWPNGAVCPTCEGTEHSYLKTRRLWKCKNCKRQFSVKVGTIFEDSAIPLDKWLAAIWLLANSKNGVSSYEVAKAIGITQKSAWFVEHRVRLAMRTGSFSRMQGPVEADETFIGGLAYNMHKDQRRKKISGTGGMNKATVMGLFERNGEVRAYPISDRTRRTLQGRIREHVELGADVYTDKASGYRGLENDYVHETVDHAIEYVKGHVHVNGIENFWSLLKRGIHGTYVSIEPFHLFRYIDERVFAFNKRKLNDFGRFALVLSQVAGRRLTYDVLTGKRLQGDGLY